MGFFGDRLKLWRVVVNICSLATYQLLIRHLAKLTSSAHHFYPFCACIGVNLILNSNFFLPKRSLIPWSIIPPQILPFPPITSQSQYIVDAVTVTAPWVSGCTPCPVTSANRDQWTEMERQKAEDRVVATDLENLQKLVPTFSCLF